MATQILQGGRRSEAPTYTPLAALTSGALQNDLIMEEMLRALRGKGSQTSGAGTPAGSTTSSVNLGEVLSSGSKTGTFSGTGGIDLSSGPSVSSSLPGSTVAQQAGATMAYGGQGMSALGILAEDPTLAKVGSTLANVGVGTYAAGQLASGDLGGAAQTVAPTILKQMGVAAPITSGFLTALVPDKDGVSAGAPDIAASVLTSALSGANPMVAAVNAISGFFGGPTIQKALGPTIKGALTPVEDRTPSPVTEAERVSQTAGTSNVSTGTTPTYTTPYLTPAGDPTGYVGGDQGE